MTRAHGSNRRRRATMVAAAVAVGLLAEGCTPARHYASRLLYHECPAVYGPTWFGVVAVGGPPTLALAPITVPLVWLSPTEPTVVIALSPLIAFGGIAGAILGTPPFLVALPFEPDDEVEILEDYQSRQRAEGEAQAPAGGSSDAPEDSTPRPSAGGGRSRR